MRVDKLVVGKSSLEFYPKGHWIKFRSKIDPPQPEHIKCSNCGQYWAISEHAKIFKYCFNCGAKMKEEVKE